MPAALKRIITYFLLLIGTALVVTAGSPEASLDLQLNAPIRTWDEAIQLGNGTMGVLVWGESNVVRLSLDRGDLWDERPSKKFREVKDRFTWAAMQRMVAENKMGEFNEVFDANYDYNGPPTKLPAGRVELVLEGSQELASFHLELSGAAAVAKIKTGNELRAFVDAGNVQEPVALVRIPGLPVHEIRLKAPDSVKLLGYPPARPGQAEGERWLEQAGSEGFAYVVYAAWRREGNETLLALTVSHNREGAAPLKVARERVNKALSAGWKARQTEHVSWWARFWAQSSVRIPEAHILQHYYLVRYFYGAASRRGAPPMPLQGVWSADAGTLPPWKGDYHNDLNTQMTYMGYQAAGHMDEGASFLDLLWELLPRFREFARDFYGAPGAAVPGVMSLAGQPLGGWGQYSLSPTMGAWNAHFFYLHWRYTADEKFLRTRAYPWCSEIGTCLLSLLKPDANGVLKLPLSSSPEVFDNTRRAFVIPNSNYDLMCMKMLFLALAEMAANVRDHAGCSKWAKSARQLGGYHTSKDGTLLIDEKTALPGSHRHLSNLMGIYPFNLITVEGGSRDQKMIDASLKQWDAVGTSAWCGYSFSWMAALRARVGHGEAALRNLDIYTRAFILRNGFHANGDQTKSGFSSMTYRPFTLEGNFLALQAVHEMLLQSWGYTVPETTTGDTNDLNRTRGIIRIFPACPWRWHNAEFHDLRAEGGHRVSARRENNATTWFRLVAGQDGLIRVRDNFGGRAITWSRNGVQKSAGLYELNLQPGDVIEATLPKPASLPPSPPNLAEPVKISR